MGDGVAERLPRKCVQPPTPATAANIYNPGTRSRNFRLTHTSLLGINSYKAMYIISIVALGATLSWCQRLTLSPHQLRRKSVKPSIVAIAANIYIFESRETNFRLLYNSLLGINPSNQIQIVIFIATV